MVATVSSAAFVVALALYGIACGFYLGHLAFGLGPSAERIARWVFVAAFAAHTFEIAWHGAHGMHPGASVREAVAFAAWVLAGIYLLLGARASAGARRLVGGAFISPVVLVLEVAARITPDTGPPEVATTALGRVHIALAMAGVAVFMAATAASIVYLLKARQLKQKRLVGGLARRGMPLETIDGFQNRMVSIGFPIFTLALLTGAAWVAKLPGGHAAAALRPEYPIALVTWLAFAVLLGGRLSRGWHGRRAALLTVLGFVASLAVLAIYMLRRAHGA